MKYRIAYYCNAPIAKPKDIFFRLSGLIDRGVYEDKYNFLNDYSIWNIEKFNYSLPKINSYLSYNDICLSRAENLIKDNPEGIAVAYSGGIDSLGIVSYLVKCGYPFNKIHLIGNDFSIKEAPNAFEYLTKNGCKITIGSKLSDHFDNIKEKVILTGNPNGYYFYPCSSKYSKELLLKPLKESFYEIYPRFNFNSFLDKDYELINEYAKSLNWEIKDLADVTSLLYLGCRFLFCTNHLSLFSLNQETREKFVNFYEHQDFEDWSFSNRALTKHLWEKSLEDKRYFKKYTKEAIYDVFGDYDYLCNKDKEGSWKKKLDQYYENNNLPLICSVKDSNGFKVEYYNPLLLSGKYPKRLKQIYYDFFGEYLKPEFK